jgi:hypothetical protein
MTRIVEEVESEPATMVPPQRHRARTQADLLARSAHDVAEGLGAKALMACTSPAIPHGGSHASIPGSLFLPHTDPGGPQSARLYLGSGALSSCRRRTPPMPSCARSMRR